MDNNLETESDAILIGGLAARPERVATGDVLEHDPAPRLGVALPEQPEGSLDTLDVVGRGVRELGGGERSRRDDEERLDRPRELVDRVGGDQAERAVHVVILSLSRGLAPSSRFPVVAARETRIGAKGAA